MHACKVGQGWELQHLLDVQRKITNHVQDEKKQNLEECFNIFFLSFPLYDGKAIFSLGRPVFCGALAQHLLTRWLQRAREAELDGWAVTLSSLGMPPILP